MVLKQLPGYAFNYDHWRVVKGKKSQWECLGRKHNLIWEAREVFPRNRHLNRNLGWSWLSRRKWEIIFSGTDKSVSNFLKQGPVLLVKPKGEKGSGVGIEGVWHERKQGHVVVAVPLPYCNFSCDKYSPHKFLQWPLKER